MAIRGIELFMLTCRLKPASLAIACGVVWLTSQAALGQGYSRVGTDISTLDRTLLNGRLLGTGRGGGNAPPARASAAAPGGYVDPSQSAARNSRGGRGDPSGFQNSQPLVRYSSQLMMPFGAIGSARAFAPPPFSGWSRMTPPLWPQQSSESTARIVQNNQLMLYQLSYNHRVWLKLVGGATRDELTNVSLAEPTDSELPDLASFAPQKTNAQRMATQVNAWHQHHADAAWQALRAGDYRAAHDGFENALVLAPDDVRSKAGQILAAAMDEQYHTAIAYLQNLLAHHDDLLSVSCPFADTLVRRQRGELIVSRVSAVAASSRQNRGFAALHAYLLWLDGRHDAARLVADAIQRDEPTSPFAVLAERMAAQLQSFDGAGDDALPVLRALSGPREP